MGVANNLKNQVDTPVWEWCRPIPAAGTTAALSASCCADNSTFTVQHGRYIYFLVTASLFYRYDTITDSYQTLDQPPITVATFSSMSFADGMGYYGRVISAPSSTTLQAPLLSGQVFKNFDIRITGGTGAGQQRTITSVADTVIADYGSATGGAVNYVTDSNKNWLPNQWVGYQVKMTISTGAVQTRKIIYNTQTALYFGDAAKYTEDNLCNGYILVAGVMAAPTGGTAYQIESSVLTVDSAFTTTPDATSRFVIMTGGIWLASAWVTSMYSLQYYDIAADMWYIKTSTTGPMLTTALTDGTIQRFSETATIWDRGTATSGTTTSLTDTTKSWSASSFTSTSPAYYVRIISGAGVGQLMPITSVSVGATPAGNTNYNTLNWTTIAGYVAPDNTSHYSIEGFDAGTATGATRCSDTAQGTSSTINGNILTLANVGSTNLFKPGMILSSTSIPGFVVATACTGAATQAVVTCASTTGIYVGMVANIIYSTGAFAGGISTVVSVTDTTHFVISQNIGTLLNAGVTGVMLSQGLGYTSAAGAAGASGQNIVTVADTAGLIAGMAVVVTTAPATGAFVATPASLATIVTVTAVTDKTHFTVSSNINTTLNGTTAVVSGFWPMTTYIVNQLTGTTGQDGTYTVYPAQTVASATITGTGVASLLDTTKSYWPANRWNNQMVRITTGPGAGQTRSIIGTLPGMLLVNRDWTVTPTSASTYVIHGDTDKILFAAGGTAAIYNHNCDADLLTLGRGLDWGAARGLTAQLLVTGQTYGYDQPIHCTSATYTAIGGTTNVTSGSSTATAITVGYSGVAFTVGSFVTIASVTPSGFNGTFRVLSSAANTVTVNSTANPGSWSSGGTIAQAASLLVQVGGGTTNPHNFQTGQTIALRGDYGVAASMAVNNANFADIFVNSAYTFTVGLTQASATATIPAQSTTRLVDSSKNWVINQWAGCTVNFIVTNAPAPASGLAPSTSIEIAANDATTLYFKGTAAVTSAVYVSRYVITPPANSTLKNMIGAMDGGISVALAGTADSAAQMVDVYKMWTSVATGCNSTGTNVITITGGNTVGLQVGMYVAVSTAAGTGQFVFAAQAGIVTNVTVTEVTDSTHFKVSAIPAVALTNATVFATFWPAKRFNGRKLRITAGTGIAQEVPITDNTGNVLTAAMTTAATGASTYAIVQGPARSTGISMMWNYGISDASRRGSFVYLPRGGATLGVDRLNLQTDTWEFVQTTPNFESLTTGTMYAYDGGDRLYFTKEVTMRVYYLDMVQNTIHPAGTYPYVAGTANVGNRMEIYTTADGLRILWLNRHQGSECFKTLLFF